MSKYLPDTLREGGYRERALRLKMFLSHFLHAKGRGVPDTSERLLCLLKKTKSLGD